MPFDGVESSMLSVVGVFASVQEVVLGLHRRVGAPLRWKLYACLLHVYAGTERDFGSGHNGDAAVFEEE